MSLCFSKDFYYLPKNELLCLKLLYKTANKQDISTLTTHEITTQLNDLLSLRQVTRIVENLEKQRFIESEYLDHYTRIFHINREKIELYQQATRITESKKEENCIEIKSKSKNKKPKKDDIPSWLKNRIKYR